MNGLQKVIAILPLFFLLLALAIPPITQQIWIRKKYTLLFSIALLYSFISIIIFGFDFSKLGFQTSLMNFIYLGYCFLFEKIFLKIKFDRTDRNYPIYIIFFEDSSDAWDKKVKGTPESADRVVSAGLALATLFTNLFLLFIVL